MRSFRFLFPVLCLCSAAFAQPNGIVYAPDARAEVTPLGLKGKLYGVQVRLVGMISAEVYRFLSGRTDPKRFSQLNCLAPSSAQTDYRCLWQIDTHGRVTASAWDQTYPATLSSQVSGTNMQLPGYYYIDIDHQAGDAIWNALTDVPITQLPGVGGNWKKTTQITCAEVFGMDLKTVSFHSCRVVIDPAGRVTGSLPASAVPPGL
jgi:hypothetical protein